MKIFLIICLFLSAPVIAFSAEIVVKEENIFSPNLQRQLTYYEGDKEIAYQEVDEYGNILKYTGTIPDGIVKFEPAAKNKRKVSVYAG